LKGVKKCKLEFCKFCVLGKQSRVQFKSATHKTYGVLNYIHFDVWGPVRTASRGGHVYFLTFIDDFFRGLDVLHATQVRNVCQVQIVES
jgi:hypothetical protein